MQYKILILESNWAEDEGEYLIDTRSTSKMYIMSPDSWTQKEPNKIELEA